MTTTCPFCGTTFDEDAASKTCSTCSAFGGCRKIKCPHCGYEMPREPAFLRWLRNKLRLLKSG